MESRRRESEYLFKLSDGFQGVNGTFAAWSNRFDPPPLFV